MIATTLIDYAPYIIAVIAGGGGLGGYALYLKARPEAGKITIDAAQGAVVVQSGVIDTLNQENARLQSRISALEVEMAKFAPLHTRIAQLEEENRKLHRQNVGLRQRIAQLERNGHVPS